MKEQIMPVVTIHGGYPALLKQIQDAIVRSS